MVTIWRTLLGFAITIPGVLPANGLSGLYAAETRLPEDAAPVSGGEALINAMLATLDDVRSGECQILVSESSMSIGPDKELAHVRKGKSINDFLTFDEYGQKYRYDLRAVNGDQTLKVYVRTPDEVFLYRLNEESSPSLTYYPEAKAAIYESGQLDPFYGTLLAYREQLIRRPPQETRQRLRHFLREMAAGAQVSAESDHIIRVDMNSSGRATQERSLWLDSSLGFVPIRATRRYRTRAEVDGIVAESWSAVETTETQWEAVNGAIVPRFITANDGSGVSRRWSCSWISVNAPIDAGKFSREQVKAVPGTYIIDKRLQVPAIVEVVDRIPPSEIARISAIPSVPTQENAIDKRPGDGKLGRTVRWQEILIVMNVALFVIVALLVAWHGIRTRRGGRERRKSA